MACQARRPLENVRGSAPAALHLFRAGSGKICSSGSGVRRASARKSCASSAARSSAPRSPNSSSEASSSLNARARKRFRGWIHRAVRFECWPRPAGDAGDELIGRCGKGPPAGGGIQWALPGMKKRARNLKPASNQSNWGADDALACNEHHPKQRVTRKAWITACRICCNLNSLAVMCVAPENRRRRRSGGDKHARTAPAGLAAGRAGWGTHGGGLFRYRLTNDRSRDEAPQ